MSSNEQYDPAEILAYGLPAPDTLKRDINYILKEYFASNAKDLAGAKIDEKVACRQSDGYLKPYIVKLQNKGQIGNVTKKGRKKWPTLTIGGTTYEPTFRKTGDPEKTAARVAEQAPITSKTHSDTSGTTTQSVSLSIRTRDNTAAPASSASAPDADDTEDLSELEDQPPVPDKLKYSGRYYQDIKVKLPTPTPQGSVPNPGPGVGKNVVLANFVAVKAWPKHLHEYFIVYGEVERTNKKREKTSRKFSNLQAKERVVRQLLKQSMFKEKAIAHDFEYIWSLEPLFTGKSEHAFGKIKFRRGDGSVEPARPDVTVRHTNSFVLPQSTGNGLFSLAKTTPHQHEGIVRALNALVTKRIKEKTNTQVFMAGANKFFPLNSWIDIGKPHEEGTGKFKKILAPGEDFVAVRGFCTSIRPSSDRLLLNILPDTSAFYRPMLLCNWIYYLAHDKDHKILGDYEAMKTAVGARCRLMYERPRTRPTGPNPNLPEIRLKTVVEFGFPVQDDLGKGLQTWVKKDDKGNVVESGTVKDHFLAIIKENPNNYWDWPCVNVGAKLKLKKGRIEASNHYSVLRINKPDDYENYEKAVWIPSSLLELTPQQMYTRTLPEYHSAKMLTVAKKSPDQNQKWITDDGLRLLGIINDQAELAALNLQVDTSLVQVPFKQLIAPTLTFKAGPKVTYDSELKLRIGYWDVAGKEFHNNAATSITDVFVICLGFPRFLMGNRYNENQRRDKVHEFLGWLTVKLDEHGLANGMAENARMYDNLDKVPPQKRKVSDLYSRIKRDHYECIRTNKDKQRDIMRDVKNVIADFAKMLPAGKSWNDTSSNFGALVAFLLPSKDSSTYATVKRIADQAGIRSICCQADKALPGDKEISQQYLSNLCLKATYRTGGDVHHVSTFDQIPEGTIVLGADLANAPGGSFGGCPSVAAVVGTLDKEYMNMPGDVRLVPARSDLIPYDAAVEMVKSRLVAWGKNNGGSLPINIIFYRDGVGKSRYEDFAAPKTTVRNDWINGGKGGRINQGGEITAIEEAYSLAAQELDVDTPKVKITFVVVGKRHSTRFFPTHQSQTYKDGKSQNNNCKPGLLVDSTVTLPNAGSIVTNFYLQSHNAIMGTAKSAHYIVLRDDMGIAAQAKPAGINPLQTITHAFCHAFSRATTAVSYCAPAYCADRLCARAEYYLRQAVPLSQNQQWAKKPDDCRTIAEAREWYWSVAEKMQDSEQWLGEQNSKGRKVPWDVTLDKTMFYL